MSEITGSAIANIIVMLLFVLLFDVFLMFIGVGQYMTVKQSIDRYIITDEYIPSELMGVGITNIEESEFQTTYHLEKDINLMMLDKFITQEDEITISQDYVIQKGDE